MSARVGALLADLIHCSTSEVAKAATAAAQRLDEPLRVAVAGRMKAGKSTLINALIGEAVAATDATECTQLVTWYRFGPERKATARVKSGAALPVGYHQHAGNAHIDLDGLEPNTVARLEVELPIDVLRTVTIIDTPGTASISEHLSSRAIDYMVESGPEDAPDVVMYLMRHLHEQDLNFLEAFGETLPSESDPLRAIGILSRADEIGNGRGDSMLVASSLAKELSHHPELSTLTASVLPVAGLLAFAAISLTTGDIAELEKLASMPEQKLDRLTRSAKSFCRVDNSVLVTPERRAHLLEQLGLFGVRVVLTSLSISSVSGEADLRATLREMGGLDPIQQTLVHRFAGRADVLRAARALGTIERLAPRIEDDEHRARTLHELDAIKANAHELVELGWLRELKLSSTLKINELDRELVVAALGGNGTEPFERLGLKKAMAPEVMRGYCLRRLDELNGISSARMQAKKAVDEAVRSIELVYHDIEPA